MAGTAISAEILDVGLINGVREPKPGMMIKKSGRSTGLTYSIVLATAVTFEVGVSHTESGLFVDQVLAGLAERAAALVEPDRARAIERAIHEAATQDVVLVAGKGHETYQEIAGQRLPFSDVDQVQQALAARQTAPEVRA